MNWSLARSNACRSGGDAGSLPESELNMERTVFFDHYRLAKGYDGAPVEIARIGAATVYKASDLRSGAPVALTLLPASSVDAEQREQFEEQARAALLLDHINIVRTVEFGRAGDDFAFVSEYPHGETVAAWVAENGPMPPDAVLRVALQIVGALGAASFHGIVHRAIEPSNIQIMSGQTVEGGWPSVKLMNFPVAGRTRGGGANGAAAEFASPEQLRDGTVDFRSEMYALGATLCFLLTGAFYSAEPRSLQTKRFAGPLRKLITPMLRYNPEERPQDPTRIAEELHSCLQRVERRQALAQRFGIPFVPVSARALPKRRIMAQPQSILAAAIARPPTPVAESEPVAQPRRVWVRRGLAMAAVLLAAATVAAMLLPAPVSMILHGHRDSASIGVPVGVAQDSSVPAAQMNSAAQADTDEAVASNAAPHAAMAVAADASESTQSKQVSVNAKPVAPSVEPSNNASSKSSVLTAATVPTPATSPVSEVTANDSTTQPPPPREGPQTVWERAAGSGAHPRIAQQSEASTDTNDGDAADSGVIQPNESKTKKTFESSVPLRSPGSKIRTTNATAKAREPLADRARLAQNSSTYSQRSAHPVMRGSVRARFAGMTPDGNLVLRFPNGETAIVPPPPGEYVPSQHRFRRTRRVIIERRTMVGPPPQPFLPFVPPDA